MEIPRIARTTVLDLLEYLEQNRDKYPHLIVEDPLIAVNNILIPINDYGTTLIIPRDNVHIIPAHAGG